MRDDLSTRVAGAAAREQVRLLRYAAPVRTFLARLFDVHTSERAWRIGADGEERTAEVLARLQRDDPRIRVLHAVPVGSRGSDIDHVVIGPRGVVTVNTKHHPGARVWVKDKGFLVNGQNQPYVRNSRFEAKRASELLTAACGRPISAIPAIVLVGQRELTVKAQPAGVHIVELGRFQKWISRLPEVLREDEVGAVYEMARRSTTWTP